MKRKLILLLLSAAALAFVASCEREKPEAPSDGAAFVLSNPQDRALVFDETVSSRIIIFTAREDWTATVQGDGPVTWVTLSAASGKAGKTSLKIKVQPNETFEDRTCKLFLETGSGEERLEIVLSQNWIKVRELEDADFRRLVYDYKASPDEWKFKGTVPAVLEFYHPGCKYCQQMLPIVEQLAEEYRGRVSFYKLSVKVKAKEALYLKVVKPKDGQIGVPCFCFLGMAGQVEKLAGVRKIEKLREKINKML